MEGTYLVWMDFSSYSMSNNELEVVMTQEAQVFFDEGYIFGEKGSGFERMNIACPTHVMLEALERIKAVFAKR
jgi:bifunctional pyridoxal-dependent enzyme with beta-cystathionase and maltose regulon repressor activities